MEVGTHVMRPVLALLVFLADLAALTILYGAPVPLARKLAWTAAILSLPIVGAVTWIGIGRHRAKASFPS